MQIVVITGMSGAGKSSALDIFEDMGYYSMDNLPPQLISDFVDLTRHSRLPIEKLAVGADVRGGSFFDAMEEAVAHLRDDGLDVSILFLDAQDDVLVRRYKELRRPHPLGDHFDLITGIQKERNLLAGIRDRANLLLDTSDLNLGGLKEAISVHYSATSDDAGFIVRVISFGYKYGMLLDGDLVFDVRFLPNPYYDKELRPQSGLSTAVRDYVFGFPETNTFMEKLTDLCDYLIPFYIREGKRGLTIGIGCTGGKHRSVAIGQDLQDRLIQAGHHVAMFHRDGKHWNE